METLHNDTVRTRNNLRPDNDNCAVGSFALSFWRSTSRAMKSRAFTAGAVRDDIRKASSGLTAFVRPAECALHRVADGSSRLQGRVHPGGFQFCDPQGLRSSMRSVSVSPMSRQWMLHVLKIGTILPHGGHWRSRPFSTLSRIGCCLPGHHRKGQRYSQQVRRNPLLSPHPGSNIPS